jgi:Putative S-adenosyl-L-methionine-dependent methyltransferase
MIFLVKTDGLYLIEVDRILRPGGYWVLSGPPVHWRKYYVGWERTKEDLKEEQDSIEEVAKRLCWKKVVEKGDLAVWQKPINHMECVNSRKTIKTPHICKSDNGDAAWYVCQIQVLNYCSVSIEVSVFLIASEIRNNNVLKL